MSLVQEHSQTVRRDQKRFPGEDVEMILLRNPSCQLKYLPDRSG